MLASLAYLSPGNLFAAVLLVIAAWWCYEILKRLPKDMEDLRTSQNNSERIVIVFFWLITALPLWYCVDFVGGLVGALTAGT